MADSLRFLVLDAREGWTCVTNDEALRKACLQENVDVRWGLELLLDLVTGGGLGHAEATAIATAIHTQNPHYVTAEILETFLEKLEKC